MRPMNIWKYAASILLCGIVTISTAAQKVDFAGTWKLNVAKSSLGGEHPWPNYDLTKIIEQKGPQVRQTEISLHASIVNIPLPDSKVTTEYVADGKERKMTGPIPFPGMPAPEIWVSAQWQGGTLLISEANGAHGAAATTRRYFLSEDGLQLIELIAARSTFKDADQRLVFDKQP